MSKTIYQNDLVYKLGEGDDIFVVDQIEGDRVVLSSYEGKEPAQLDQIEKLGKHKLQKELKNLNFNIEKLQWLKKHLEQKNKK